MNDSDKAIESDKVTIRSWPFMSSKYSQDYLNISFKDMGNSSVGIMNEAGELEVKGRYETCDEAWKAARDLGNGAVIRLDSAWILKGRLVLDGNSEITLDLNGYPMIRPMKRTTEVNRAAQQLQHKTST